MTDSDEIVWEGRPSLWKWSLFLILGVLTSVILVGIFILIWVFASRAKTRYVVTKRTLKIEEGIFTKSSRELRIQDIRSINTQSTFGYGRIEFSTAATDDAEIIFGGIFHVGKIANLVKSLQS